MSRTLIPMTQVSENAVERIRTLQEQLARTGGHRAPQRKLLAAIHVAAGTYRRALDREQAAKQFDRRR